MVIDQAIARDPALRDGTPIDKPPALGSFKLLAQAACSSCLLKLPAQIACSNCLLRSACFDLLGFN